MAVGSSNSFDLVVLGGGTGGYSAAFRAAQMGLHTALVEEARIGGTCLHWGCIPAKAMLESADLYARVRDAASYGLRVDEHGVDMPAIARRRAQVVDRLTKGLMGLVKKNQVEFVPGHGVLERATTVRVTLNGEDGTPGAGGERVLDATDVIVATGSRVKSLPGLVPDGTRIVTSDDVLRSETLPKRLIVVGAGAVGVEFASFYRDMGSEVTLLEYLPGVVPLEDAEVGQVLERAFRRRGIAVMTSARFDPAAVTVDDAGVRLSVGPEGKPPKELQADQLLVATGRASNLEGIGLERTRAVVERGFLKVDGWMRTAEPHLYAIGDLVGGLLLAHVAAHEGITAVETICGLDPDPIDYTRMPRATYSRPQIASIGRSEQELERDGVPYRVGKFPWIANGKAIIGGEYDGFAKVLAHAETDRVLGVHLVGPHVTDLIAEASVGMFLESTAWELASAVHPHPTLSEAIGEAAMAVAGRSINF
ncbi:MAG: dihydrolipoyl dehydrogenase [Candidatus Limnocylindrales bacterium]